VIVQSGEEAAASCAGLQFPLAAKIVSADIPHKTEAGGVVLGVRDVRELASAVDTVLRNAKAHAPRARIEGVLIAEMITDAVEMLLGVVADAAFGPTLVLGMGGVQAELLRDVTHRIAPFDEDTAREMLDELRGAPLLFGYRGRPRADVDALVAAVARLSQAAWMHRDRLLELDVNPLFVRPQGHGVIAADALVRLA
jgi:acetyltransferase